MKRDRKKYGNTRFNSISEDIRFDSLFFPNIGEIPQITKMGISTGYSEIDVKVFEICIIGSQKLLSKRYAPESRYRIRTHKDADSIGKRFGIAIYIHQKIRSILQKIRRNWEDFWRLRQKVGYVLIKAAKRGGNWNNDSGKAGMSALNLNNEPSNRNNNISFRASLISIITGVLFFTENKREYGLPRIHILVDFIVKSAKNMNRLAVVSRWTLNIAANHIN